MGHQVRLQMATAVRWPIDLAAIAAAVRDQVGRQVGALTGFTVAAVDVTIDEVVVPNSTASTPRRVR